MKTTNWDLHITQFKFAMDKFGSAKREWVVHYIPFGRVATFENKADAELFVAAKELEHG